MSEVNKINLNDTLFDIEDTVARENITTMQANIANDLDACSLVAEEDKSIAGAYAVQQLNRSLQWKLLGSATGTTPISLPSNFSELLIDTGINNHAQSYSFSLIKNQLTDTVRHYRNGQYKSANAYAFIEINVSLSEIYLSDARYNGTDYIDSSVIDVYYR